MAAARPRRKSRNPRQSLKPDVILVIYDGACPFCRAYVRLLRLRQDIGPVELLSAREADPRIAQYQQQGFDPDQGMLVVMSGVVHAGADAMQVLAACSTPVGWFNRCNRLVFSSARLSRWLYPVLRAGRYIALRLRGLPLIGEARH
jgi:predicted DCC family thiol-disulfide oxidoreductase YuxK